MSIPQLLLRRVVSGLKLAREDTVEILCSLITLRPQAPDMEEPLIKTFIQLTKYDPSLVADTMQKVRVDPLAVNHGARLSFLATALPKMQTDEMMWENLIRAAERGLNTGKWTPRECRYLVAQIAKWGVYPKPSFPNCIEQYVAARVGHADQQDLTCLNYILTAIPETSKSPLMLTVAQRAMALVDVLTPGSIGMICRQWVRAHYHNAELLQSLNTRVGHVIPSFYISASIAFFAFSVNHPKDISEEHLPLLLTRMSETMENADADLLIILMRALKDLPEQLRVGALEPWQFLITSLSEQCCTILAEDTTLTIETATTLLLKYFRLFEALPPQESLLEAAKEGMKAFSKYIMDKVEDFVSDENPPFAMIPPLVIANLPETRECALGILKEASDQEILLPTLNVFRYVLVLHDHQLWEKQAIQYLRKAFMLTAKGIPLIQLATALKCFSMSHRALYPPSKTAAEGEEDGEGKATRSFPDETEDETEERMTFLSECHSIVQLSNEKDIKSLLSMTSSMYELQYDSDAFYELVCRSLEVLISSAQPDIHSSVSATICLQALQKQLPSRPSVEKFLKEASANGLKTEATNPTRWMNENDPSSLLAPLTAEQQKMRELVESIRKTSSYETAQIEKYAASYVSMINKSRLEDVYMVFAVFADKVIKLDKYLNEALKYLLSTNSVSKLSVFSISSMMQSMAQIRFAYHQTTKKFLLAVTEEQWALFDIASVCIILSAMAKLSLRLSAPLMLIGERIVSVAKLLTPMDIAQCICCLQTLGFHDEAVMNVLIQRATEDAADFNYLAISNLFSSPHIARLLTSVEIVEPLVKKLAAFGAHYSPQERQRIAANLKRTSISKDTVKAALSLLESGPGSSSASKMKALSS